MDMRILVGYATHHGQTRKIAAAMAQRMRERGHAAELMELPWLGPAPALSGYDGVVLGSPLYGARHLRRVVRFVRRRREALAALPTAFFSVSLSAGSQDERARGDAERCVDQFVSTAGWKPGLRACFAGSLAYLRYNWILKRVMRRISAANGGSSDMTRNHEYTDWNQVEAFTDAYIAGATAARKERHVTTPDAQELRAAVR
jgi:menaquinone-dependent protoporphyrinogen oxidase